MADATDPLWITSGHRSPKVMNANEISHRITRPMATS
jgi:hypothetical protein